MPSRFDKYRVKDGLTKLGEGFFNPVFQDLDLRLVGLEALRISWQAALSTVTDFGLVRVNEVIGPTLSDAMAKADEIETKRQAAITSLQALQAVIVGLETTTTDDISAWKAAQLASIQAWKDSITSSLPTLQADMAALQAKPAGGIRLAPVAGGQLTETDVIYAFPAPAAYTLPDITGKSIGLLALKTAADNLPTAVTTADGWSLATGFSEDTLDLIVPTSTVTPHGTWPSTTLTAPTLASVNGAVSSMITGTAELTSTLVIVTFRNGSNHYAVALNPVTHQFGAPVVLSTYSSSSYYISVFADSENSFVFVGCSASGTQTIRAGSVNGLDITLGAAATTTSNLVDGPVKLANGLYLLAIAETNSLQAFTVAGTLVTLGAAVAAGSSSNATGAIKIRRSSDTEALVVYLATGGGTTTTRNLSARVATITGTTITLGAASAAATSVCYSTGLRVAIAATEGATYIVCVRDGTTSTTGHWYGISVAGTTAAVGAINTKVADLPYDQIPQTYRYQKRSDVFRYDGSTVLFGHLSGKIYAIGIIGNALTFGPQITASSGTFYFARNTQTEADVWATGSSSNAHKLSVSGTTVSISMTVTVSTSPRIIVSDTLSSRFVAYAGTHYQWSVDGVVAIAPTKWLIDQLPTQCILLTGPVA